MTAQAATKLVEKALAFAHAAIDETTPQRVAEAKSYAANVLPKIAGMRNAFTLGEAQQFVAAVGQLRAVLAVLERKLAFTTPDAAN